MTDRIPSRGARIAAPLAVVAVVAGCGGARSPHASAPAATPRPAVSVAADPAAAAMLRRAEGVLSATRSYRFDAVETVAAATPVTTRVTGTVVRAQGVAYVLTVGRARTQVIRMRSGTYVRRFPGRWSKLQRPRRVADPSASLGDILRGLTAVRSSGSRVVTGALPAAAAARAGIPTAGGPAQVSVTVDATGHVTRLVVRTASAAGARHVGVTLVTSYADFGRAPSLRAPI